MGDSVGEFEQLVLFAAIRLEDTATAVTIRQEIERRVQRTVSSGALYTALDRLEARGFVRSALGEPTAVRGGKRRRFYTVQPAGAQALTRAYDAMQKMASGLHERLQSLLP
jgi:PadR family transcriptional regulator, regulatory protein PadR